MTTGLWVQEPASASCCGVRAVGVDPDPSVLTSSNSFAYRPLHTGFGPSVHTCAALRSRNGLTTASHVFGWLTNEGGVGRHLPGPSPTGNPGAEATRRSSARR